MLMAFSMTLTAALARARVVAERRLADGLAGGADVVPDELQHIILHRPAVAHDALVAPVLIDGIRHVADHAAGHVFQVLGYFVYRHLLCVLF